MQGLGGMQNATIYIGAPKGIQSDLLVNAQDILGIYPRNQSQEHFGEWTMWLGDRGKSKAVPRLPWFSCVCYVFRKKYKRENKMSSALVGT